MQSIYKEDQYLEKNPAWHVEDSSWKAKQIIRIIEKNKIKFSTLCDIGCGAGEILYQLSERFREDITYRGYEISSHAYELCQKRRKKNLQFFLADMLEESKECCDITMAINVFEHVEDFFGFLRRLRKRGRYKIFHIPLDLSVQTVLRGSPIMRKRECVGHIHYFTKETALAALKDTGYKILDCFYTFSSIDLPCKGWKAKVLILPRKACFKFIRILP